VKLTFLLGECRTGAGGDGGPLGIFLLILEETEKPQINADLFTANKYTPFLHSRAETYRLWWSGYMHMSGAALCVD